MTLVSTGFVDLQIDVEWVMVRTVIVLAKLLEGVVCMRPLLRPGYEVIPVWVGWLKFLFGIGW